MSWRLERDHLAALARGYELLGSGGGGDTAMLELLTRDRARWPIDIVDESELDPGTPCLAAAFVGSTTLLKERLPGLDPFGPLIDAIQRWLGHRVPAVCGFEGGGLNGLSPLLVAGDRMLVDADLVGRAVPDLDQMSLFVDRIPGLVLATDTGAGGVAMVSSDRAVDVERVVRASVVQAGGVGSIVLGGFTVGDLQEHSVTGHLARALTLGRGYVAAAHESLDRLAVAVEGRLVASGRIASVGSLVGDPHVTVAEVVGTHGEVHRIVCRSETLAVMTDGELVSSSPSVIAAIDIASREILQVEDFASARDIAVIELPVSPWWYQRPGRLSRVLPSAHGVPGLDAA